MTEINDLSTTAANNNLPAPDGWPEGQIINSINNASREDLARLARWYGDHKGSITTAGTLTAYTYASARTITAYYDGLDIVADFHVTCGASPTFNVDAVAAAPLIWPDGTALVADDIPINAKVMLRYDGVSFQVMTVANPPASLNRINSFTQIQKWAKGADVASAAALTLGDDGNSFDVTGTATITSIVTKGVGTAVRLHFDGVLVLTHNATDLVLPTSANITTAVGDIAVFEEYATGDWRCVGYSRATGESLASTSSSHGECRLTKSGVNLLLSPQDGNQVLIDGVPQVVPSAGVTLAATGLTIDTDHFIYVFMSGATMTLEALTTGHSTDSSTGVEIKTADSTRTLVGLGRPITGPAWQDAADQRFVISWFNRKDIRGFANFTTNRTSTSSANPPTAEIDQEIRNEFLTWGDEAVTAMASGGNESSVPTNVFTALSYDATGTVDPTQTALPASGQPLSVGFANAADSLSEGYHFLTVKGATSSGTGTWRGSGTVGANNRWTLTTLIQG